MPLEEEAAVKKTGKDRVEEQARAQRYLPLKDLAREALWDTVIFSGFAYAQEALEEERRAILRRALRALGRSGSNAFGACCEFADAGRAGW